MSLGWLCQPQELDFNEEEIFGTCNSICVFRRQSVPLIPQSPPKSFLPIQEGNQTRQPWSNQMTAHWSNWEDSRQQFLVRVFLKKSVPRLVGRTCVYPP